MGDGYISIILNKKKIKNEFDSKFWFLKKLNSELVVLTSTDNVGANKKNFNEN
jgi:hypothetical protein